MDIDKAMAMWKEAVLSMFCFTVRDNQLETLALQVFVMQ